MGFNSSSGSSTSHEESTSKQRQAVLGPTAAGVAQGMDYLQQYVQPVVQQMGTLGQVSEQGLGRASWLMGTDFTYSPEQSLDDAVLNFSQVRNENQLQNALTSLKNGNLSEADRQVALEQAQTLMQGTRQSTMQGIKGKLQQLKKQRRNAGGAAKKQALGREIGALKETKYDIKQGLQTLNQQLQAGDVNQYSGRTVKGATQQEIQDQIMSSPGFQAKLESARQQVEQSAASRGMLFSGQTGQDIYDTSYNLVNEEYQQQLANSLGLAQSGSPYSMTQANVQTALGQQMSQLGLVQDQQYFLSPWTAQSESIKDSSSSESRFGLSL